jgi:hypothetical protein
MADEIIVRSDGNGLIVSNVAVDGAADAEIGTQQTTVFTGVEMATLRDLLDVDTSNLTSGTNKYVMTYDVLTNKFKFVNPDAVIDSSVGVSTDDPNPVGMTTATINYLDKVLDNKIDLDAGEW